MNEDDGMCMIHVVRSKAGVQKQHAYDNLCCIQFSRLCLVHEGPKSEIVVLAAVHP
jgi:hypothetical protein